MNAIGKPNALVIDDDPDFLDLYTIQLRSRFEVSVASDGAEGLRKLGEVKPSVVLLDLRMPKVSGRQVLEAMHEDPGLRDVPVIVVTNRHVSEDIRALYGSMRNVLEVFEKTVSPRTVADHALKAAFLGRLYQETEGLSEKMRAMEKALGSKK